MKINYIVILAMTSFLAIGSALGNSSLCIVGTPYTKENDLSCQIKGFDACWKNGISWGEQSPWVVGKIAELKEYSDCTRVCAVNNTCWYKKWYQSIDPNIKCRTPDSKRIRNLLRTNPLDQFGSQIALRNLKKIKVPVIRKALGCDPEFLLNNIDPRSIRMAK